MSNLFSVKCAHCGGLNELRLTKANLKGTMPCRSCRREFPAFEAAIAAVANPAVFSSSEPTTGLGKIKPLRTHQRSAGYSPFK